MQQRPPALASPVVIMRASVPIADHQLVALLVGQLGLRDNGGPNSASSPIVSIGQLSPCVLVSYHTRHRRRSFVAWVDPPSSLYVG
jgi:hypothetical protein